MAQLTEAAPKNIKLSEIQAPPPEKKHSPASILRYLKTSGKAALYTTVVGAALTACSGRDKIDTNFYQKSPTVQPGVKIVHSTETPMPSSTATIESFKSPTIKPSQTSEVAKTATKTPESRQILEEPYVVSVDQTVDANSAEMQTLIQEVKDAAANLPKISKKPINIVITNDPLPEDGYYDNSTKDRKIKISSKISPSRIESVKDHELGHMMLDTYYWQEVEKLSPEALSQLKKLIVDAQNDPVYGIRNADIFPDFFRQATVQAKNTSLLNAPIGDILEAKVKIYGESCKVFGRANRNDPNGLEDYIKTSLDDITSAVSQNAAFADTTNLNTLSEILANPQIDQLYQQEAQKNPTFAYVLSKLKDYAPLINETTINTDTTPVGIRLKGSTIGETAQNVAKYLGVAVLMDGVRQNDPQLKTNLQQMGKWQEALSIQLSKDNQFDNEALSDAIAASLIRTDAKDGIIASRIPTFLEEQAKN